MNVWQMDQNSQPEFQILFSTSRNPSRRTRTLIKDLTWVFPRASRIPRGTKNIYELAAMALAARASSLVIVSTRKGNPGRMSFYRVTEQKYFQLPLEMSLTGVKLRNEFPKKNPARPNELLILPKEPLSSRGKLLCERVSQIFRLPIIDSPQPVGKTAIIMNIEEPDVIRITFTHGASTTEIGPQLRIRKVNFFGQASI
jgi:U3 small nucleolar ribonucleoprotein protein IMP4